MEQVASLISTGTGTSYVTFTLLLHWPSFWAFLF